MNRLVLLCLAAVCVASLAAEDPGKEHARDLEQGRRQHAAMADKDRDIAALKADAAKWRAAAEMCHDRSAAASASASAPLRQ